MDIENRIKQLQKCIETQKKEKGMIADIKIIEDLINQEWKQDTIEKIRDERKDDRQLTLRLEGGE